MFTVSMGIAVTFAALLLHRELAEPAELVPVSAPRESWTPPGLPFWMSERLLAFTAFTIAVFVAALAK